MNTLPDDLNSLTVKVLKELLAERGLKVSGLKAALVERLEAWRIEQTTPTATEPQPLQDQQPQQQGEDRPQHHREQQQDQETLLKQQEPPQQQPVVAELDYNNDVVVEQPISTTDSPTSPSQITLLAPIDRHDEDDDNNDDDDDDDDNNNDANDENAQSSRWSVAAPSVVTRLIAEITGDVDNASDAHDNDNALAAREVLLSSRFSVVCAR